VQKKAIVLPISSREGFQRANRKSRARRVRGALLSLSPTETFCLSLPRSTFPRGGFPRISVIFRAERSTAPSVKEESMHTVWPRRSREAWRCHVREAKQQKHRRGKTKRAREKIRWGMGARKKREREREGGRERGDEERHRAMCTTAVRCYSVRCVSVCRAGGRPRSMASRSAAFVGARSRSALGQWWSHWPPRASRQWHRAVPSTPLLPPNARRFPSVSPLGVSPADARCPPPRLTWRQRHATTPPIVPYLARLRFSSTSSSPPHMRGKRREWDGKKERQWGRDGENHRHCAPLTVVPCATLGACCHRNVPALPRDARSEPTFLEFS